MIKIKLVGQELSGNLYITERSTYIMDTNFSKSKDTSRMSLHTLSWNNSDGEPNKALKSDKFVVVDEF
jgi:hypothetical protein